MSDAVTPTGQVPSCRLCGLAILEVLDHGRDLWDGLCGDCAYRKFMLQHGLPTPLELCEWCSEAGADAPLREWDDGRGEGVSWICERCYRGASASDQEAAHLEATQRAESPFD